MDWPGSFGLRGRVRTRPKRQVRKHLHALVHAKNDVGVAFHDDLLEVSDLVRSPKLRHKLDVGELVARVRRVGAPRVGPVPDGSVDTEDCSRWIHTSRQRPWRSIEGR